MGGLTKRWVLSVSAGVFIGASALAMASAGAQPVPPPPPGPAAPGSTGSTDEELGDMVMDVIESAAPSTTQPPRPR